MRIREATTRGGMALLATLLLATPACSKGGPDLDDGGKPKDGGSDSRTGDGSAEGDGSTDVDGSTNDAGADGSGFEPILLPDGGTVFPTNDAGQVLCGTEACICSDGIDNDGDGLTDGFDPECTGPYDNDEDSFATGIPGDNRDDNQDCFFDGNSGSGGGDCMIPSICIVEGNTQACQDALKGKRTLAEESAKCIDTCAPRAPNGCDCFGCCEVFTSGSDSSHVIIEEACQVEVDAQGHAVLGDDCRTCAPSAVCGNECGRCELCLGRTPDDLPDDCTSTPTDDGGAGTPDGGTTEPPAYECVDGAGNPQPTCSPDQPCGGNAYCYNGCCFVTIN